MLLLFVFRSCVLRRSQSTNSHNSLSYQDKLRPYRYHTVFLDLVPKIPLLSSNLSPQSHWNKRIPTTLPTVRLAVLGHPRTFGVLFFDECTLWKCFTLYATAHHQISIFSLLLYLQNLHSPHGMALQACFEQSAERGQQILGQ